MKTNNFFDLDRFMGLLKQDLLFNFKFYTAFVAGFGMGIFVFCYLLIRNFDTTTPYQIVYNILFNLLVGTTIVFAGMSFPAFRNQKNSGNYLLIPGSAFEKMMVQFVVRIILFIPIAMILLQLAVFLAVSLMLPDPKSGFDPIFVDDFSFWKPFHGINLGFDIVTLSKLVFPMIAFAGSVYFKRYAVVKTLGSMVIPLGMLLLIKKVGGVHHNVIGTGSDQLFGIILDINSFYSEFSPLFLTFVLFSLPWVYYKLREKEI